MNLQPINPAPSRERGNQFRFVCRECGHVRVADERTHADLDAAPYSAYVCGDCLGIERHRPETLPIKARQNADMTFWQNEQRLDILRRTWGS